MSFHDASFDAALSFHVAMKAFGKPEGLLGRTGGYILAMGKGEASAWFIDLLNVSSHERALEVGFGRGFALPRYRQGLSKSCWIGESRISEAILQNSKSYFVGACRSRASAKSRYSLDFPNLPDQGIP